MKRLLVRYYLVFIALFAAYPELQSQEIVDGAAAERLVVCTDRTLYVSGEKVLFSVVLFNPKDCSSVSRIVYCELITPDGNKIVNRKYILQLSSGQGCITIPEETISGIYFLRFYTRFMRNSGTKEYPCIQLKIVNPVRSEVLAGRDTPGSAMQAGNREMVSGAGDTLELLPGRKIFAPGEEILLNIRQPDPTEPLSRICLSVIPENTFIDPVSPQKMNQHKAGNGFYRHETRGISLSGQVIGKESRKPVPGVRVSLSIIGDKDIFVVHSDSVGRFFYALPDYHGTRDLFLCVEELPDIKPEILIDNDFCSRPTELPSPRFTLSDEEMKTAFDLAVNARLTALFTKDTLISNTPAGEAENTPFYGDPDDVLVMDKYIELPTLEEYFNELPVSVKVRKTEGRKHFRFFDARDEMSLYDPLVLVDWVAVDDIKKILAMSPKEIDRIELVNSPYVKGNITFGGIISFISKKNNFAGIDLPTSGTFINYRFLEDCAEINIPDSLPANIPDSRNTVYWNPNVQTRDDVTAHIAFTAPGTPGIYYILLRHVRPDGTGVLKKERFVVK